MKKIVFIILVFGTFISCMKSRQRGNICISADITTLSLNESITVSNCGDIPPSNFVESEIDWGDGSTSSGLSGTHEYNTEGDFTIKVLLNGDYAEANSEDVESKVEIEITVE